MERLTQAIAALQRGDVVALYDADGREEETDLVVLSEHCTPEVLRRFRTDAGGLVCTTVAPDHHARLGLPYLTDLMQDSIDRHPVLAGLMPDDIQYDGTKPAFGITLNHRSTFTGITDDDRSTTIQALVDLVQETQAADPKDAQVRLGQEFRSPGHVILLNGAPGGLDARQGHTELSIELALLAGASGSTTICEMLGRDGKALPRNEAEAYAADNGLVFLTGQDILDAWKENPVHTPA